MTPADGITGTTFVDDGRLCEVVWHGAKVDAFGTKGGILGWLPRGSMFYLLPHAHGPSKDPDDQATRYNRNRIAAIERARRSA